MSRAKMPWRDEWELLCEGCGYSIEGLPREGVCPECGKRVAESLPEVRVGTAWQQAPGVGSWAKTMRSLLCSPRRTLRELAIERDPVGRFGEVNVIWAGFVLSLTLTLAVGFGWIFRDIPVLGMFAVRGSVGGEELAGLGMLYLASWIATCGLFWLLTVVEYLGIRTFGRLQHARITPTIARSVAVQATAGWVVVAGLASLGLLLGLGTLHIALRHNVGVLRGPMMLGPIWLPMLGGFVGLLCFEMLVYVGIRQCRFANRAGPALEPPPGVVDGLSSKSPEGAECPGVSQGT